MEWIVEQSLLSIYLFLAHRIHGLTLNDFWEMNTFATSFLYCQSYNIMEHENESINETKKSTPKQTYTISGEELFAETKI